MLTPRAFLQTDGGLSPAPSRGIQIWDAQTGEAIMQLSREGVQVRYGLLFSRRPSDLFPSFETITSESGMHKPGQRWRNSELEMPKQVVDMASASQNGRYLAIVV